MVGRKLPLLTAEYSDEWMNGWMLYTQLIKTRMDCLLV